MTKVVKANPDLDHRPAVEAAQVVRFYALAKGSPADALSLAQAHRASDRVTQTFEKAAIAPGGLSDPASGGSADLASWQSLAAAFLQSLQHASIFDAVLPHAVKVPLFATVGVTTLAPAGHDAAEGEFKKISELHVGASGQVPVTKSACILVFTSDLLKSSSPDALQLIRKELRAGVARATDTRFLELVTAGAESFASAGDDLASIRFGLKQLLQSVSTGSQSKLFFVTSSTIAKGLSAMGGNSGQSFGAMTPSGGEIFGVETVVSDVVAEDEIILISADQIACSAGTLGLSASSHSTLRLSDTPDSEPTMTSLWQANLRAIRVERYMGATPLRDTCAAILTGVDLDGTV
jgi:hypothetical protein